MFENWTESRYEKILYESKCSEHQRALLAGISRAMRISHGNRKDSEAAVVATASGLVAPLVFFYTWWTLRSALKRGIRRIYFMARDGQIFMRAAEVLVRNWNLEIDVRYLHCSRESLLLPSFEQVGDFELNWITWGYLSTITTAEICRRVGLTPEELRPFLETGGLQSNASLPDKAVKREDMPQLHKILKGDDFAGAVRQTTKPLFDTAMSYFEQEGFFDGVPFALADTGWRGSSQYAVSALMHKGGVRPDGGLTGLYVGLNCDAHRFGNDTLEAFLFDWRSTPRDYRLYCFICFEMLFSSDSGRTIGYQRKGDVIVPIFGSEQDGVIRDLVKIHHDYSVEYSSRASSAICFDTLDEEAVEVSRCLSRSFICSPTKMEADIYGEWPIASEMGESDFQPMSPPMGFAQFLRCATGREKVKGFWPQAGLVRGNQRLLCKAYNGFLYLGVLDWYRRFLLRY